MAAGGSAPGEGTASAQGSSSGAVRTPAEGSPPGEVAGALPERSPAGDVGCSPPPPPRAIAGQLRGGEVEPLDRLRELDARARGARAMSSAVARSGDHAAGSQGNKAWHKPFARVRPTVSGRGRDAAVAGGARAAAAGKFPPSFNPRKKLPPLDPTPPPAQQGDPSPILPLPPRQHQQPKFYLIRKEWMTGRSPKERLASNFYAETVMQYKYFDARQRDSFLNVCAQINKRVVNDALIREWNFFFEESVFGTAMGRHLRTAFGVEVARRCAADNWQTPSNQVPINFEMVLEILTCNPYFADYPINGERLVLAIVKWIYVLTIETAHENEWVYRALTTYFETHDMRVKLMDDLDPQSSGIMSHKRINSFARFAKQKGSAGPQNKLSRALLKRYGIIFPMKGRTTEERKQKTEPPDDGSQWFSYDLSADITNRWTSNMTRTEGCTFWVQMVRKPVMEEIAMKKATEIFTEAEKHGIKYERAHNIMISALETVRKEREVTDATAPLLDEFLLATQEDPIVPVEPNHGSIAVPENMNFQSLPVTNETNEITGKDDDKMADDGSTEMVEANDDETLPHDEGDEFENAFPNDDDIVSSKNLVYMKCLTQNLIHCPTHNHFAGGKENLNKNEGPAR